MTAFRIFMVRFVVRLFEICQGYRESAGFSQMGLFCDLYCRYSVFYLPGQPSEWPGRAVTNNSGMPFLYKYIALEWQK